VATDKGGGLRGEGGTLADATDASVTSRITNRSQQDSSIGRRLSNAELQTIEPEGSSTELDTKQYIVKGVGGDVLLCKEIVGGAESGQFVTVAKPPELRQTAFDGLTRSDKTYAYQSSILRTVEEDGLTTEETISPSYIADETIIYVTVVNTTDISGIILLDLNTGGRTWQPTAKRRRYLVTGLGTDTLIGIRLVGNVETGDPIILARSFELRQTPFDGLTISGKTYSYTTTILRNVDDGADDEDQLIIPPYILNVTEVVGILIKDGTGVSGINIEALAGGRAWAKVV